MSNKKVIFIVGPTASGKTALSVELAQRLGGEIISADSMQIYKGIHIASAAPDVQEQGGIPHHLLEFLELDRGFSVAEYVKLAREKINEITAKGSIPIVVGGTGLYINSLLDNTEFCEEQTDPWLRESLEREFDTLGGEKMLERLRGFDPESAQKLSPNDKKRIVRWFEILKTTGKTKQEQNELSHQNAADFDSLVIGITYRDREILYSRIDRRVDLMLSAGLLEEASGTFSISAKQGAFQAIGHKELYGYFKGEISLEEAVEHLKRQTRRYAKRQLTWFRRDGRINWVFPDENSDFLQTALDISNKFIKGGS